MVNVLKKKSNDFPLCLSTGSSRLLLPMKAKPEVKHLNLLVLVLSKWIFMASDSDESRVECLL